MRTPSEDSFIIGKVDSALAQDGLPPDSPIRAILLNEAKIVSTGRDFYVTAWRPDGDVSLEQRIDQLRKDPRYFPQPTVIASRDMQTLADHFDEIAKGTVTVE